jgi:hypothetical protein
MNYYENIKSIIIVMDEHFGLTKFKDDFSNDLIGIDLFKFSEDSLEFLKNKNIDIKVLIPFSISQLSLKRIKQFYPEIDFLTYETNFSSTLEQITSIVEPQSCIFVASDRIIRSRALTKGFVVLPHISIATLVIEKKKFSFVHLQSNSDKFREIKGLVPYYIEQSENKKWSLFAIMSEEAIRQAITRRMSIQILQLDISIEEPLLVYLDKIDEKTYEKLKNFKVVVFDGKKMLLGINSSQTIDSIPFHDMHGHFNSIFPNPSLLLTIDKVSIFDRSQKIESLIKKWPKNKLKVSKLITDESLADNISNQIDLFDEKIFQSYVDKYSGKTDLDNIGKINSRHCEHPDNSRVINALLNDLRSIGYSPYTYSFYYTPPGKEEPIRLYNVIADLPGTGYLVPEENLADQVRNIFIRNLDSSTRINQTEQLLGKDWIKDQKLDSLSQLELNKNLKKIFNLQPWIPWEKKDIELPGSDSEIIIIGCHLDSTGSASGTSSIPYHPSQDPAPGADDDGSGIAGVLTAAKYLSQYRGKFIHTIRFCFFNAEEVGLNGSKNYAATLRGTGAPIKTVICMDMIGYNKKNPEDKLFEIHAGFDIESYRDISVPVAIKAKEWAERIGQLGKPQIYKGTRPDRFPEDTDLEIFDGAIRRSDHASFQEHGYPSILLSEDLFIGPDNPSDSKDTNPNYHKFEDKSDIIDSFYGSAIACVAAHLTKDLAIK